MTGEALYAGYRDALADQGVEVDSWTELYATERKAWAWTELYATERKAWDTLAEKLAWR